MVSLQVLRLVPVESTESSHRAHRCPCWSEDGVISAHSRLPLPYDTGGQSLQQTINLGARILRELRVLGQFKPGRGGLGRFPFTKRFWTRGEGIDRLMHHRTGPEDPRRTARRGEQLIGCDPGQCAGWRPFRDRRGIDMLIGANQASTLAVIELPASIPTFDNSHFVHAIGTYGTLATATWGGGI